MPPSEAEEGSLRSRLLVAVVVSLTLWAALAAVVVGVFS